MWSHEARSYRVRGPAITAKLPATSAKIQKNVRGSFGLITPAIQTTTAIAGVMSQMVPAGLSYPRTSCFHTLGGQRMRGQDDTAPFSCIQNLYAYRRAYRRKTRRSPSMFDQRLCTMGVFHYEARWPTRFETASTNVTHFFPSFTVLSQG